MPNANRDKGIRAELDVVRYFRELGAPEEWQVRRSAETGTATRQDRGDVHGIPSVCVQVKNTPSVNMIGSALEICLIALERQRLAARASVGVLVEKRAGCAYPRDWWAWIDLDAAFLLCSGMAANVPGLRERRHPLTGLAIPIRMRFGDLAEDIVSYAKTVDGEARP